MAMGIFLGLALLVAVLSQQTGCKVHPSPYKDLSQTLNIAGARWSKNVPVRWARSRWSKVPASPSVMRPG